MKVFVSGASGFLGGAVAAELARRGHEVSGLVRSARAKLLVRDIGAVPVMGDLMEDGPWTGAVKKSDCVVSLTAPLGFEDRLSLGSLDAYTDEHSRGVANLIAAAKHGRAASLVVTYDTMCFGGRAGSLVDEPEALRPTGFCRPIGYSYDTIASAALDAGIPLVDVFPARVYGPGDWFGYMVKRVTDGTWRMAGDGGNYMSVIHIDDLARAYAEIVEKVRSAETLALADGSPCTQKEFSYFIADSIGKARPEASEYYEFAAREGIMLAESLAVSAKVTGRKAAGLLGLRPAYRDYREGIVAVLKSMGIEPLKVGG